MKSIAELIDLSGRKALVTGGAGHIGEGAAETLVELGAQVAIVDLVEADCRKVSARLGDHAFPLPCDLQNTEMTRTAVHKAVEFMGGLDILVHCAAFVGTTQNPGWAVPFEEQSTDAWESGLRVNLTSAFVLVQEARGSLALSGNGSVILFSSIYGMVGPDMSLYEGTSMANPAGYNASKGGLLQLMRYLATNLAPQIRVNAISPGGVARNQPAPFMDRYESRTPLKRMAVEEDFKGAVAYLASGLSNYVTGHNLVVDGGWTAW
jgi:NAD(P)-dependent dehydrogenase (short-subunit alcohol dehydrogenase family)